MKIKEARKRKHMTQKELADKIGVNFSVVSRYENGTIIPPANRLQRISDILEVSVDFLLGKEDDVLFEGQRRVFFDSLAADMFLVSQSAAKCRLLEQSNGICELCGNKAPFDDKDGVPYLEIHLIQWRSEGGLPVPENTVALCPNCHRKVHILNDKEDIEKLKEAAEKHK